MNQKTYEHPIAPKRCPECGGVMVWGDLGWSVFNARWRALTAPSAATPTVERADMPKQRLPVVVNICTVCGHIGFYAAQPL